MGKPLLEYLIWSRPLRRSLDWNCRMRTWTWRKMRRGNWMEYHLKCRKLGYVRI
jgi:hypothetical protein